MNTPFSTRASRPSCLWMGPTAILSINNNKDFGEIGNYMRRLVRCAEQNVTLSPSLKSSHAVWSCHGCFYALLNNWWALMSILTNLGTQTLILTWWIQIPELERICTRDSHMKLSPCVWREFAFILFWIISDFSGEK